jgi:hypothetical protein
MKNFYISIIKKQTTKLKNVLQVSVDTSLRMILKRSSTSHVTREIQIRAIMRFHYTLTRLAKIQNTDKNQMLQKIWNNKNYYLLYVGCKMVQPLLKTVSYKQNILLPYDPQSCTLVFSQGKGKLEADIYFTSTHNC